MKHEIQPLPSEEEFGLVPMQIGRIGIVDVNVVDARQLHASLGSEREFSTWIKTKIERFGFVRGRDYEVFDKFVKNLKRNLGGRPGKDYILTLGVAKELSMVENNLMGRKIRNYFIDCERQVIADLQKQAERAKLAQQQKAIPAPAHVAFDKNNLIPGPYHNIVEKMKAAGQNDLYILAVEGQSGVSIRTVSSLAEIRATWSDERTRDILVSQPMPNAKKAVVLTVAALQADLSVLKDGVFAGARLAQVHQTLSKMINLVLGWEPEPRSEPLSELEGQEDQEGVSAVEFRNLGTYISARNKRITTLVAHQYGETLMISHDRPASALVAESYRKRIAAELSERIEAFDVFTEEGAQRAVAFVGSWEPVRA